MSNVKIRDIKVIATAPSGIDLVVVKVETSEPGLYGLGCATFTQRWQAVVTALEVNLKPILIGRSVDDIEDIWESAIGSSYWRRGPVLNNAISGVDEALWDIKGKMAGMPVYQLLGGRCRQGATVYRHAHGKTYEDMKAVIKGHIEQGFRYVRVGCSSMEEIPSHPIMKTDNAKEGAYFTNRGVAEQLEEMFRRLKEDFRGQDIQFCYDIHEHMSPIEALQVAKKVEPYGLLFLEDALSPENSDWYSMIRNQSHVPIAMGELFTNPAEYKMLISKRLIDYIRCHISMIGGITPAKKLATFAEFYGVKTAWHGPHDISPVGVAAQLHIDVNVPNFGIQEFFGFSEVEKDMFPGLPKTKDGYLYPNELPGLGIDINEELAKEYPAQFREHSHDWFLTRLPDGTPVRP